jgi:hypothetical protein
MLFPRDISIAYKNWQHAVIAALKSREIYEMIYPTDCQKHVIYGKKLRAYAVEISLGK